MNILIPNVTGPTNIGDQAILKGLISLLRENYKEARITIHSSTPEFYKEKISEKINPHLYFWSVLENRNPFVRVFRLMQLFLNYILFRVGLHVTVGERVLRDILNDYYDADLIIFTGGGYLRSRRGLKQSLNLLMILTPFWFAKCLNIKCVVAPISFGPFAYRWQEKLSASVLRGVDIVSVREKFSFDLLKASRIPKLTLSSDLALLIEPIDLVKLDEHHIIGFTIREWGTKNDQKLLEEAFIEALATFSKNNGAIIQPIVQVDASQYGDYDAAATERVVQGLQSIGIKPRPIKHINGISDALHTYAELEILVGMRMHSNIFATIQRVPFVAVSYEHKFEGITHDLGVEDFSIQWKEVSPKQLYHLMEKAYQTRDTLQALLEKSVITIREREREQWHNILGTTLSLGARKEADIKICYFGAYTETYSRNAINIRGLRENGAEVVFCHVGKPKFKSESQLSFIIALALYPITFPIRASYSFIKGLFLYFRGPYDVIFVGYQGHFDVPAAFLLAKILQKPLIFDTLESLFDVFVNDKKLIRDNSVLAKTLFVIEKQIYKLCDAILLDTEINKTFFIELFGIDPKKVFATQIGSDNTIYRYDPTFNNQKKETFNVVFYGFQSPLHGLAHVIRAAEMCKDDQSIQFFLVGSGQSYAENKALVEKLGLRNVTFSTLTESTGAIEFLKTADIMLGFFANNSTGMRSIPNKALQGMAMKKPVLTAKGAGIVNVFTHKKNIYLCEAENARSIANAILELRSNDALRKEIAQNGYELYQERFTPKAIGKKLIMICKSIILKK